MQFTISFTADSIESLAAQLTSALGGITPTQPATAESTELPIKTEAPAKPKRAKKEPEEKFDLDDTSEPKEEPKSQTKAIKLDMEDDIIPAFQAYKKRKTEEVGSEKALKLTRNILAKFGAEKSVRDLKPDHYADALAMVR